jgi:PAS domain S-box-containing protein
LKRLATVVTDSNDAITVQTTDGRIVSWNRGAERMYGYSEATALGMMLNEIIPAAIQSQEAELFAKVCRGEPVRAWHTQRVAQNGNILDVDLTATPLPDENGEIAAISTTERDITEQMATARQMSRLAAIVESSPDAIIGKSLDGIITDWNSGAEKVYRYSAADAIGRSVTMLSPVNRQDEMSRLLKQVRAGESVEHFETVHVDHQGLTLDVSLTISPIKDAGDTIVGAATIARDISDRKQLERKVLETADEERRRIGQDLHDETGQELTGLGLIAETLAEALEREKSAESPLARKILQGLKRAISHVRAMSRGLVPVEIDSGGLMAALTSLAARISEVVGVDCAFVSTQPVLVEDNAVATHLYRIAQEAVGNALKHGKPRRIEIELTSNKDSLILSVQDNGSGFRQRSQTSEGMGLRIMRHRASLIGAELQVEARAGSGVQVRCVLNRSPSSLRESR